MLVYDYRAPAGQRERMTEEGRVVECTAVMRVCDTGKSGRHRGGLVDWAQAGETYL